MKNRVAIFVLLAAIALLPACTMWREHPVSNWADATGGEGLERSFWKEVKTKKWNELETALASNFISVTPEEGRSDPVRMMTVWQRQKAGWMAIAHSVMGPAQKTDNK